MIPLSKAAPDNPHLVNANKDINVTDEIRRSILASRVTPIFLFSFARVLTLSHSASCQIIFPLTELSARRIIFIGINE